MSKNIDWEKLDHVECWFGESNIGEYVCVSEIRSGFRVGFMGKRDIDFKKIGETQTLIAAMHVCDLHYERKTKSKRFRKAIKRLAGL